MTLGEPLPQRAVTTSRPVAQDRAAVMLERRERAIRELLDGETLRRRDATRERDHRRSVAAASAGLYFIRSATICATSVGVVPTRIPTASSASFFACAVPDEPLMIAPAWPIVFPGGAEKPAM